MIKRFNGFDVLVILLIIIVGIVGYKYLNKEEAAAIETGKTTVRFIARADGIINDAVQQIQVGDTLIGNGLLLEATIKELSIENAKMIEAIDGEIKVLEDDSRKSIIVTIEGKANKYGPYIDLGGQQIKAGSAYKISTESFEVQGKILTVEGE